MTKKIIFYLCALAIVLVPSFAFAYTPPSLWPTGYWGGGTGLISCTGFYSTSTSGMSPLPPCTSLTDLIDTAENIIYFGITIVIFIITPILFAWGGIMFMFSQGKPEGITKAKKILTGALIGLLIALCAWLIVNTVVNALGIQYIGGFSPGT